MKSAFTLLFALNFVLLVGCQRSSMPPTSGPGGTDTGAQAAAKSITSFVIKATDNPNVLTADISANITADTIRLVFEQGTKISGLVPTIAITGKTVSPASKTPENFDSALVYTVTAQDGSTMHYPVLVTFISGNKNITGFTFRAADNSPNLSADFTATIGTAPTGTDTITATVPYGTPLTALVPYITITGKAVSPASLTAEDFTNPVKYTVTAGDGTTKTYLVIVTVAPSPVAGTIFVAGPTPALNPYTTGGFYAIDAATGKIKWSYLENNFFYAEPTAAGGLVYELDEGGNMLAFNQNTVAISWSTPIGHQYNDASNATVVNGTLYVGGSDSSLYALNASTGAIEWKINTVVNPGSPTVAGGVVYFASDKLYAVNASTGAQLWSSYPSPYTDDEFPGRPDVVNGIVYIGAIGNYFYALDASTGKLLWNFASGQVSSSSTVANGIVYVLNEIGTLYALDATTGAQKWSYPTGFSPLGSPIVGGGMAYFNSPDGYLFALDANTGVLKWTYTLGAAEGYSPLLFGGSIFVAEVDRLYSINAVTGTLNWSTPTTPYWPTNPCAVDTAGNVYQTSDAGSQQ
jgi:outer membrane protein assembly factor BamB